MKWFLTVVVLWASQSYAEPMLHVGAAAGINTAVYTLCTGAMGREVSLRGTCLIGSSVMTGLVAFTSEYADSVSTRSSTIDTHDLAMDAVGIGVSSLLIYLIDINGKKDGPQLGVNQNRLTVGWKW